MFGLAEALIVLLCVRRLCMLSRERSPTMHDTHFSSIEKLDTAILYLFELLSSLAILLLAFGLIASMANVLTEESVLSDNITMQHIWAWTQCVAIDASVAGTILRTFRYYERREWVKTGLSALLSALLLFTAAIVSNIEALQQTLNVTLSTAYAHVFVPVEVLIWIRSLCIVLLIVAHALRHVRPESVQESRRTVRLLSAQGQAPERLTPTTTVEEEHLQALPDPQSELATKERDVRLSEPSGANSIPPKEERGATSSHPEANNYERIKRYLSEHPDASVREMARALSLSASTVSKWTHALQRKKISSEEERTPSLS
jgi:hypothetical protein